MNNDYKTARNNIYMAICFRCKWEWIPRKDVIKTCANCRSPYWDRARDKKEYDEMRSLSTKILNNCRYKNLFKMLQDEKCVDCGKQATQYEHRDYARPLLVEPVCVKCNKKRGRAVNFPKKIWRM